MYFKRWMPASYYRKSIEPCWLQTEMERQAKEKYLSGEYTLRKLNKDGQRISIRIEIPRKIGDGTVLFLAGCWNLVGS